MIRLGVVADPQYADSDDGAQFGSPERVRYYRNSLCILDKAFEAFEASSTHHNIVLGDILDAKTKRNGDTAACMKRVIDTIENHIGDSDQDTEKVTFVCGNHDFFNFTREAIFNLKFFVPKQFQAQCSPERLYHCQEMSEDIACIYLDTYEVSVDGGVGAQCQRATDIIKNNNSNWGHNADWLAGLTEDKKRFVPYNGGMTDKQLLWLQDTLSSCKGKGQRVIVFVHAALIVGSCRPSAVSWSAEQALTLLQDSGIVLAVFSGHDHDGGFLVDEVGIRHITPPAPLEAPPGTAAYGILHISVNKDTQEESVRTRFEWRGGDHYPRELRSRINEGTLTDEEMAQRAFWNGEWWSR